MTDLRWLPDWSGKSVCIVGCGPSAKSANLRAVEAAGCAVLAIKEAYNLCRKPPAMVYGCDRAWWVHARGLPKYAGLKIAYDRKLGEEFHDIRFVGVVPLADDLIMEPVGTLAGGGNSGFQAMNLALQCGARRIMLVGIDLNADVHPHFYGHNTWIGSSNPMETNFIRWQRAFSRAARQLTDIPGSDVVCSSMTSSLSGYIREPIERTLERWRTTE